ncbi:MAG TPA: hypothetical protein VK034_05210, partial [Enhygromyxa sp.]|nr:hypothetical protein [Enhygromyxa sp.]
GTFIASNKQRPWWVLWLFIGGLLVLTLGHSWLVNDGDVSHGRLMSKGFTEAPQSFAFLQVAGPLFLLILTRMKIPVSTTFLILSSFASSAKGITAILSKSLTGYLIAFVASIVIWLVLGRLIDRRFNPNRPLRVRPAAQAAQSGHSDLDLWFKGDAHPGWYAIQWISTACLWCMWLTQDAANVAVFLPRALDFSQFAVLAGVLFLGLALLFRLGGDRIQQIVEEKAVVVDVRHATMIDAVYAVILMVFTVWSKIPMSTTWVFLGLLAGREIGIHVTRARAERRSAREVGRLIGKDLLYVTFGLAVSIVIAAAVNPNIAGTLLSL